MTTKEKLLKHQQSYAYNPLIGNFVSWIVGLIIMSFYVNQFSENSDLMLIGTFVGSLWTIRLHAYREAFRIEVLNIKIDHTARVVQRTAIAVVIGLLIHILDSGFQAMSYARAAGCAVFLLGTFFLFFDFILNLDRGKALFYVSNWYKTSKLDKFFSKIHSPTLCLVSKIIVFLATLALYHRILIS